MGETDYAYAVANIRANEHKLITKADLRGFISASSADGIIRSLKERGYDTSSVQTDDELIKIQNAKIFSYLKDLSENSKLFDSFLMRNDFHNVKVLIKAKISEMNGDDLLLYPSLLDPGAIKACINHNDFSSLPDWLKEAAQTAFLTAAETKDGQLLDIIIDKAMMGEIKKAAKTSKNEFMIGLVGKQIVLLNIKIALRACRAKKDKSFILNALIDSDLIDTHDLASAATKPDTLIEFFKSHGFQEAAKALFEQNITAFEKYVDDEIIRYVSTVKYNVFGIEPLIAYLIYNETEQKNLQIILAGKRAGISESEIMERMRESYA